MKKGEVSEQKDDWTEVSRIEENISEQVEESAEIHINLGHGMYITEIGKYTGIYMEDGSDELVSDIMMIKVTNEGEQTIQYAEIMMPVGDKEAIFEENLSLYEDCVKIQKLDGAMNIFNISEANIGGDIIVYYKNKMSDLLYGGITYRVKIEGGLKKGEVK